VTILAVACQLIAFLVVGILVDQFLQSTGPTLTFLIGDVVVRGLTSGAVALAILTLWNELGTAVVLDVPDRADLAWILSGTVAMVGIVLGGALVLIATTFFDYVYVFDGFGFLSTDPMVLAVPLSLLVVGPGIELLFRGVVQRQLREGLGAAGAILGSSLLLLGVWRITWLGDPQAVAIWAIPATVLVLVPLIIIGVAYERTGNIAVPAVLHGVLLSLLYVMATTINPFHVF
jgi:membrane protease YdiL (CAAX protease family)